VQAAAASVQVILSRTQSAEELEAAIKLSLLLEPEAEAEQVANPLARSGSQLSRAGSG
jgi:hypothetical protein